MTTQKTQPKRRINKQKEIEQKKRKRRKIILIIFIILCIITAICIYLLTSDVFKIQTIEIIGNEQLTPEEILELSEVKQGDNIFITTEIVTKVKLKRNGYIEDVKLQKEYPNKIKIEVKERQKAYQILTQTGCDIYIDGQGYLLDYSLEKLELPVITGMEITENQIGEINRLQENDLDKMENILHIQDEAQKIEIGTQIQQIDVQDEYVVHIDNERIIINLGDATNLENKMYYVKAILKQEEGNSGTIFVNGNINEGFAPYFRAN